MSEERGRVLGFGGIFFKSADHQNLRKWYAAQLGVGDGGDFHQFFWRPAEGSD
jgi:hypothetical protein